MVRPTLNEKGSVITVNSGRVVGGAKVDARTGTLIEDRG